MRLRKSAFVVCTLSVAVLATVQLLTPRSTAHTPVPASQEPLPLSPWSTDMVESLARAGRERKDVLLVFTDSDPDSSGQALEKNLNDPKFLAEASRRFVLVNFSAGEQSAARLTSRATWAERLGVSTLPSVYVIDDKGRACGSFAAPSGDVDHLLKIVHDLGDIRSRRDAAFAAAGAVQGIEKAKRLDEGLSFVGECKRSYLDVMTQIVKLDGDNAAGLRGKYQEFVSQANIDAAIQNEVYPLIDQHQFLPAIERINKLIDQQSPTGSQKQMLMAFQGQLYQSHGDKAQAIACLDRALELDLNGPAVPQIRKARSHLLEDQQ